ncbi:hypothetical protein T492DRAFT_892983 [Pavlovales sp. CCMP2436]|nr:hypothetical protein T492DRAFT_892983 [Pavlovales sp. CCMP2436]
MPLMGITSSSLVGEKGKQTATFTNENRESVTLSPIICFDGSCPTLQVIFAMNATKKGYQTSKSWLALTRAFHTSCVAKGVTSPIAFLVDGHISRFDIHVLIFCRANQIPFSLSPPNTTGLTLDQINHALHYPGQRRSHLSLHYLEKDGSDDGSHICGSFKQVGLIPELFSVTLMPCDKFLQATGFSTGASPVTAVMRTPLFRRAAAASGPSSLDAPPDEYLPVAAGDVRQGLTLWFQRLYTERVKGGRKRVGVSMHGFLEEAGALEALQARRASRRRPTSSRRRRRAVAAVLKKAATAAASATITRRMAQRQLLAPRKQWNGRTVTPMSAGSSGSDAGSSRRPYGAKSY